MDVKDKLAEVSHLLSGLSRELNDFELEPFKLTTDNIDELIGHYLIPKDNNIEGKAKKMLRWLKHQSRNYGEYLGVQFEKDSSIVYARNSEEFIALVKLLEDSDFVYTRGETNVGFELSLSASGWTSALTLEKKNSEFEQVFVAIWFDSVMDGSINAICSAVTKAGYKPMCIKEEHFSAKIIDKALGEIRASKFLIIDLTGERQSVFFEAGFASGLGLEIIYVYDGSKEITSGSPQEFYVKHYQCNKYETPNELEDIVLNAIKARIPKS